MIRKRFAAICEQFPLLKRELLQLETNEEERLLLETVYAGLDVHDLPSVEPERMLGYVRASIRMRRELSYARDVPEELFLNYVLPPRVNNEYLDGSREWLYQQLKSRIIGMTMLDAALEVNFWCFEQAVYRSTDDRTIAPLGMCRRGFGRCGEESTLLTSALRAVGVPARQVYVPWWAHCDDNHAWVEFWADGIWHHMGACEPEPAPDTGWFESAASRAMLVRSRMPDDLAERGFRVVNSTERYADTVELTVVVKKENQPVSGVMVEFQLINESYLRPIHSEKTDAHGMVRFRTGFGCMIVSAVADGRLIERAVDLRQERSATLRWEAGFDPLCDEQDRRFELIPPKEKIPAFYEENQEHRQRMKRCDEIRRIREAAYASKENPWLNAARGNAAEIEAFLNLRQYGMEDKIALLDTMAQKDFADATCGILEDYLAAALKWKGKYPHDVWKNRILAPRVEHEMLQCVRGKLQSYFENSGFQSESDVRLWMRQHLRALPEYGLTDRRGNAWGYVRHGICPESEWDTLAVQICRAVGIPAVLSGGSEHTVQLTIHCGEPLRKGEHWSLSRWAAGKYRPVDFPEAMTGQLEPGSYSLVLSRRQIDGTVSAFVKRFILCGDLELSVTLPEDQMANMLKKVPLPIHSEGSPCLLLFLQPGAEPTEHLLLELLELGQEFRDGRWPMRLMVRSMNELENETLAKVIDSIPGCCCGLFDPPQHYQIQSAMGIGDARLPLAVVVDGKGKGIYGCANYNIRTAHRLLRILKML